jgi:hypothetical protein
MQDREESRVHVHHFGFNMDGTPMKPSNETPYKEYSSGTTRSVSQDTHDGHFIVTYDFSQTRF